MGIDAHSLGDMEYAISSWEKALALIDREKNPGRYIDTSVNLADAYQTLGFQRRALDRLTMARPLVKKSQDRYRNAQFFNKLGDIWFSLGNIETALTYLEHGVYEALETQNGFILAGV